MAKIMKEVLGGILCTIVTLLETLKLIYDVANKGGLVVVLTN